MKKNLKGELEILSQHLEDLTDYTKSLWQFLPLALCSLSPRGLILEVNQAFETLSLWPISEISGKPLNSILSEKETSEIIDQTLKKKSLSNQETNLLTKKGEEIAVAAYSRVREDREGNIIGFFLALVDIRESKKFRGELEQRVNEKTRELREKMEELEKTKTSLLNILEDVEEARRKAEEERDKTQAIITNFADGLLVFDKGNNLTLINPQVEVFFDIKSEDLIGRPIFELSTFPTLRPLINLIGEEIKGVFRKELLIKENLTLEVSTIPMISGEERLGTLVTLRDVTREKMIERMNKVHTLKTEADNMHQKFIEIKQQTKSIYQKSVEIMNQVTSLKQKLRQIEEEKQSKSQLELLQELKKKAKEKMKHGEKLTWEEFQVLAQEGINDKA